MDEYSLMYFFRVDFYIKKKALKMDTDFGMFIKRRPSMMLD